MNDYEIVKKIGEGAHGFVMKALNKKTGKEVALKRLVIKNLSEGIPKNVMREILSLQILSSEYVVQLYDIVPQGMGLILIMEYLPYNLYDVIKDVDNPINEPHIKCYMKMLLLGVDYLHDKHIMHRDLKPANLLIASDGILKIADLGLARIYSPDDADRKYSHQVATRWYRAPELLYGSKQYSDAVDMWAVGCIFGELYNKTPLFPGETDIEQLAIVLHTLGTPTTETWPDLLSLPDYNKITFGYSHGSKWSEILPNVPKPARDLAKNLLRYNHKQRFTPKAALKQPYFFVQPIACHPSDLPKPTIAEEVIDVHNFDT